jgi:sulfopyruvate decarboxylase TPP-binding subunit
VIDPIEFARQAAALGYRWYAGVPCSFLTGLINHVSTDPALSYVSSANEGDAVAAAAGAWVGGQRSIALMQNSGLGNAVSPPPKPLIKLRREMPIRYLLVGISMSTGGRRARFTGVSSQ